MRVAYVGPFLARADSPGLQRVLGISAALATRGHDVTVAGQGAAYPVIESRPGVTLVGFGGVVGKSRWSRIMDGHGLRQWLEGLDQVPDVIVAYGGAGPFTRIVERWAKQHGVARVIDSVEWYESSHMAGGAFSPKALDNEYAMRVRYPRYDGAIAISRFLDVHYSARGVVTVRVPPLIDVDSVEQADKPTTGPIRLVYAGSPGKKDNLGTVISAVQQVDPLGTHIKLDVLGVDAKQATRLPGVPSGLVASVEYHGRVSRAEALKRVALADYIPLVRPDQRFAHAGFPTKVVEAMAAGTAVLGNHTSDLAEHIKDMQTGLVIADDSVASVAEGLSRAIQGAKPMAVGLGARARAHAEDAFHFARHAEALSNWLESVRHDF